MSLLSSALGVLTQLVSQLMDDPLADADDAHVGEVGDRRRCERRSGGRPEQREDARAGSDSRAREQRAPTHSVFTHPASSYT